MTAKTVLVTGIGGNVGQGILRNIISLDWNIRLIGTNTEQLSGGNHLCDKAYKVPFAFDPSFVAAFEEICKKEMVGLIIPGTDFESYYLIKNKHCFPTVAASPENTAFIFLDKFNTYTHFSENNIPFAASVLPKDYKGEFSEIIVKPRKGRGSRGITINPPDVSIFDSEEYMVQELHRGPEITTAFYVTKNNELLGYITFERTLSAGATNTCIVTSDYDEQALVIIKKMMTALDIKGACNIQSIATQNGPIIPFEINGRISGTNSIRSNFGFEDVRYTIEEYLLNKTPEKPTIKKGAAVRILMDVIYPDITSLDLIENKNTKHYLF